MRRMSAVAQPHDTRGGACTFAAGALERMLFIAVCRHGDKRRRRRLERAGPPTFDALVEALALDRWRVHGDVAASVDAVLAGAKPPVQVTAGLSPHRNVDYPHRTSEAGSPRRIPNDAAGLDPGSQVMVDLSDAFYAAGSGSPLNPFVTSLTQ